MSKSGRPDDVGGTEAAEALRDPTVTRLLHVCGEHIDLVVDTVFQTCCVPYGRPEFLKRQLHEQTSNSDLLWLRPVMRALQSRYADCQCSAFGSLVVKNAVISGSMAEELYNPGRPPKYQSTSDLDVMFEMGPVCWTFPGTETSPVEDTAAGPVTATEADPRGQGSDPTPRLLIEETEDPGFVLVLQERRDGCPHQERRPFKAETVTQLFKDNYMITDGGEVTERSMQGPACSYVQKVRSEPGAVSDVDEVPCLRVPVWWFSDEFFTRPRRYNWPPKAMQDNIRRYGLHLVPVGAPGSSTEKLQWRLSFSRAELVVTSDLTDLQRCAVIAFKVCKTAVGEEGKLIKSYYVKTALFWLCEQTPTEDWTSVVQGFVKLLDYLDHAVSTGYLPCFFWSRINLLRFTNGSDRKAMKKALGKIRHHHMRLLVHEVCVLCPSVQEMLADQTRRLPERQLRVCLTRWLVVKGVFNSIRLHESVSDRLHKLHTRDDTIVHTRRGDEPVPQLQLRAQCADVAVPGAGRGSGRRVLTGQLTCRR